MSLRSGISAALHRWHGAGALWACVYAGAALAGEPRVASGTLVTPVVGAGLSVPSLGVASLLQTLIGLAVVLGVVVGIAWLARRFGLQTPHLGSAVKVVGGVMLSGKERVVVVEIQNTWLVLGVAPGQVNMLHSLPAQAQPRTASAPGAFADRLRESLSNRFGARSGSDRPSDRDRT